MCACVLSKPSRHSIDGCQSCAYSDLVTTSVFDPSIFKICSVPIWPGLKVKVKLGYIIVRYKA